MPRDLKRFYGDGHLHFITCSCHQRRPFLRTPEARDIFLKVFEEVRCRYCFSVNGYVVMPEHFHILITEPEFGTPSTVMQVLKQRTGRMLRPVGAERVWQSRFYDFNVWNSEKRIEKLKYIHRIPIARGLVQKPEEWTWSSFCDYAQIRSGIVRINTTQGWNQPSPTLCFAKDGHPSNSLCLPEALSCNFR